MHCLPVHDVSVHDAFEQFYSLFVFALRVACRATAFFLAGIRRHLLSLYVTYSVYQIFKFCLSLASFDLE